MSILRGTFPALIVLCSTTTAQDLLVSSRNTDEVLRYDAKGTLVGRVAGGGLDNPVGITFGPGGDLFVTSANTDQVLRYDGIIGTFRGVFVAGLDRPRHLNFAPDGSLCVANAATNQILRFDPGSGAALGLLASDPGLSGTTGFTFGPSGDLWVGGVLSRNVVRFDGRTGVRRATLTSPQLTAPHDLSFGPDGLLYVTNAVGADKVVRIDPQRNVVLDVFVADPALLAPLGLCWLPGGDLLVANQGADEVRRYDGASGAFVSVPVSPGNGGLSGPLFLALAPASQLDVLPPAPAGVGVSAVFAVVGARPGGLVVDVVGLQPGNLPLPFCLGVNLAITDPVPLGVAAADESGGALWRLDVPSNVAGLSVLLQALDLTGCAVSPLRRHAF